MRVGEKAKLRIKKKYAFGRPGEVEKLTFPQGYEEGDRREKITTKAVIYEVELLQFIPRQDIEHNGSIFKQVLEPQTERYDHETPSNLDEVSATI